MAYAYETIRDAKLKARNEAILDKEKWYVTMGTLVKDGQSSTRYWAISFLEMKSARDDLKKNAYMYYDAHGNEVRTDDEENGMRVLALDQEQWDLVVSMLDLKEQEDVLTDAEQELRRKIKGETA